MNRWSVTLLVTHTLILFLFVMHTFFLGRSGNYVDFFIPIPVIDYPVTVFIEYIGNLFSIQSFLNNRIVILMLFAILGGAQWYLIGFALSKLADMLFGK